MLSTSWFYLSFSALSRFKLKYHPEDSAKRKAEQKAMLMKRVEVYMDFLNRKKIDEVPKSPVIQYNKTPKKRTSKIRISDTSLDTS